MQDNISLSNYDVADIYQKMLTGDKGSLFQLQQVNFKSHLPRFVHNHRHKTKINTEETANNQEEEH
jgi:hypothetical protein